MARQLRWIKDILWFFAFWGLVAGAFRLWFGLGATTHLTDSVPWGIWKVLNMIAGVALATSGFVVGFLVYVLRIRRFEPLMKPAILVAFLGYGSSCFALLFDIGLPQRFWHPLVMWNEHSFLFEVFWCVMLYFTVTALELAPSVLERLRAERWSRALHGAAFGVVVIGISLSSLHHSSLGSLFLVTPERLHPLWYTPFLPLFFILSAMGSGIMLLILLWIVRARLYDPDSVFGPETPGSAPCLLALADHDERPPRAPGPDLAMLVGLARISAGILGIYLILRLLDLIWHGGWPALVAGTWESVLYIFELVLGALIPVALVAHPAVRRSPALLAVASLSAVCGLILNRLDVGVFGYFRDAGSVYLPSLAEWALSIGVVAAAGIVFLAAVEHLDIFGRATGMPLQSPLTFRNAFDSLSHVWNTALWSGVSRVTLIAIMVLPVAWVSMYPPYNPSKLEQSPVRPPAALDSARTILRLDGDRRGVFTDFKHIEHQERLGGVSSCSHCHHVSLPGDRSTPCSRCHRRMLAPTDLFDHWAHVVAVAAREHWTGARGINRACAACHPADRPRSAADAHSCHTCHTSDMWLNAERDTTANLAASSSYQQAMHGTCVSCHRERAASVNRPSLGECMTCHGEASPEPAQWATAAAD